MTSERGKAEMVANMQKLLATKATSPVTAAATEEAQPLSMVANMRKVMKQQPQRSDER